MPIRTTVVGSWPIPFGQRLELKRYYAGETSDEDAHTPSCKPRLGSRWTSRSPAASARSWAARSSRPTFCTTSRRDSMASRP